MLGAQGVTGLTILQPGCWLPAGPAAARSFPVLVNDQPDLLLADGPVFSPDEVVPVPAPVFEPGNPSSSRTALLQQVNPDLSLQDAVACLDRWQAEGMAVLDIDARLGELHRHTRC